MARHATATVCKYGVLVAFCLLLVPWIVAVLVAYAVHAVLLPIVVWALWCRGGALAEI